MAGGERQHLDLMRMLDWFGTDVLGLVECLRLLSIPRAPPTELQQLPLV